MKPEPPKGGRRVMRSPVEREKVVLENRLAEVARAERLVLAIAERQGFAGGDRFAIKLALEEALANAIKHGNRLDPSKRVIVECCADEREMRVTVTDEGAGFDPDHLPDPTLDENLEKPYGRGVMLMRAYMNGVEFNDTGTSVTMIKRRGEPAGPPGAQTPDG